MTTHPPLSKKGQYRLCVTSKRIISALVNHGIMERKSYHLQYPVIPKHLDLHFIRGYFDGDGGWGFNKHTGQMVFYLDGTKEFIAETQNRLVRKSNIRKTKIADRGNGITYKLQYTGNKRVYSIFKLLYQNADQDILLERKLDKFYSLIKEANKMHPKSSLVKLSDCY